MSKLEDAQTRLAAYFVLTAMEPGKFKIEETSEQKKLDAMKGLLIGVCGTAAGCAGIFGFFPHEIIHGSSKMAMSDLLFKVCLNIPFLFSLLIILIGIAGLLSFCTFTFGSLERYVSPNRYETRSQLLGRRVVDVYTDRILKVETTTGSQKYGAKKDYRLVITGESKNPSKRYAIIMDSDELWQIQAMGELVSSYTGWPLQQ